MVAPLPVPPTESRQRWRLTYSCAEAAPGFGPREQATAWESRLIESGLPLVGRDLTASRPRIVFAAPLGVGVRAERELADIFLADRLSIGAVREALDGHLPAGHDLVDLHDVWLGAPALPGQVVAADYRGGVAVIGSPQDGPGDVPSRASVIAALAIAAQNLLEASSLPRERARGGRTVRYDLRPLVGALEVRRASTSGRGERDHEIWIRVRFDPERGIGRPAEVLAELGEVSGLRLAFVSLVRERVVLAETLGAPGAVAALV